MARVENVRPVVRGREKRLYSTRVSAKALPCTLNTDQVAEPVRCCRRLKLHLLLCVTISRLLALGHFDTFCPRRHSFHSNNYLQMTTASSLLRSSSSATRGPSPF